MSTLRYGIFFLISILSAMQALASKEGMLPISSFSLHSQGIGSSGVIDLIGKQTASGISSMKITAFGREYVLADPLLSQLRSHSMNGIQLSYEQGYKQYGGKTLYVSFTQGFTTGLIGVTVLTVKEKGDMRIDKKM